MCVDDAGSYNTKDGTRYYILAGIVINEVDYKGIKKSIQRYKLENFKGEYVDGEVHVHDIYKSQPPFSSVLLHEKYALLDNLYDLLNKMPITIISVAVDKFLFEIGYPRWNLFNTAWTILFQRFDRFIEGKADGEEKGKIRIDKSTKEQQSNIIKLVTYLKKDLSESRRINHIIGKPYFINSELSEPIQTADAVSYCIHKHLSGIKRFDPYWKKIQPKFYSKNNQIFAYGLNIFPNEFTI